MNLFLLGFFLFVCFFKTGTELLSHNSNSPMTADYRLFQERTIIVNFYDENDDMCSIHVQEVFLSVRLLFFEFFSNVEISSKSKLN